MDKKSWGEKKLSNDLELRSDKWSCGEFSVRPEKQIYDNHQPLLLQLKIINIWL